MTPTECDLLIHNACVVTMDVRRSVHRHGAVAVEGRRILAVGAEVDMRSRFRPAASIDAGGGIVHPGFIDAHNHVVHTTCRGVFANVHVGGIVNFADWKAEVNEEDEAAAVTLASLEMLQSGFTMFIEPGSLFFPDAAAAAVERVGLRALFSPLYLWDRREPFDAIPSLESPRLMARAPIDHERCMRSIDSQLHRNSDSSARVGGYVFVYGEGTASPELLRAAHACARKHEVPLHLHAGYVPQTGAIARASSGTSQLELLRELGALDESTVIVHGNALDDAEERALRESGCALVWCPVAFFSLGLGYQHRFLMGERLRHGVRIALGADGAFDSPIAETMRAARFVSQSYGDPIGPQALLEMQTVQGAAAAGMTDEIGSLEAGKRADLVVRRYCAAESHPDNNPVHALALNLGPGSVDTVLVDGQVVLREGRSTRIDEREAFQAVGASVNARASRLGIDAGPSWPVID